MFININSQSVCSERLNTPCLNCRMREIGCHSICILYENYKSDLEELKTKYKNDNTYVRSRAYLNWANRYYKNCYSQT